MGVELRRYPQSNRLGNEQVAGHDAFGNDTGRSEGTGEAGGVDAGAHSEAAIQRQRGPSV